MNKYLFIVVISTLSLQACTREPEKLPEKVYVREVTLTGIGYGYKSQAEIEIYDHYRKMHFKETVSCNDWDAESTLKHKIGTEYKVYDVSNTVLPKWYKLSGRFC